MNDDEKDKHSQNLFKTLQKDPKSIFYTALNISNTLLKKKKKKKTIYKKDKFFKKLYEGLEDKKFYQKTDKIPLTTPFFDKKAYIIAQHFIV